MILRDVAESVGMHESTISRVTTNKYVHTPQGLFELKYFFNSSIRRMADEDIASESVKQAIKKIIDDEDKPNPLSRSADRRAPREARRHPDRAPNRRQVPRDARHSLVEQAQEALLIAAGRALGGAVMRLAALDSRMRLARRAPHRREPLGSLDSPEPLTRHAVETLRARVGRRDASR